MSAETVREQRPDAPVIVERPASARADGRAFDPGRYALVHLVAQEADKGLIGPQVVDHMAWQATATGEGAPARVVVGLLESGRAAFAPRVRESAVALRRRAPGLPILVLPYASRMGRRLNAPLLGLALRAHVGRLPVVFHCRNEDAAAWALALRPYVRGGGIVADIRGSWAEDLVYARGYDDPAVADPDTLHAYHEAMRRLRTALAHAGAVLTVSRGLVDWLTELGVEPDRLDYVPCCVRELTYSPAVRREVRAALGLEGRLVIATVSGMMTRYQHLGDGIAPFFRAMSAQYPDAHLLCIVSNPEEARAAFAAAGVPTERVTALALPQREVARYLAAADGGLLLKAPSRLNRFVQPVKLGEYLASGVPVIVSRGTGRVDRRIEEAGAGLVIDAFGVGESSLERTADRVYRTLRERGDAMRHAALALCAEEFLWARHTTTVRRAYARALADLR